MAIAVTMESCTTQKPSLSPNFTLYWEPLRVHLPYALILHSNGNRCDNGKLHYSKTVAFPRILHSIGNRCDNGMLNYLKTISLLHISIFHRASSSTHSCMLCRSPNDFAAW